MKGWAVLHLQLSQCVMGCKGSVTSDLCAMVKHVLHILWLAYEIMDNLIKFTCKGEFVTLQKITGLNPFGSTSRTVCILRYFKPLLLSILPLFSSYLFTSAKRRDLFPCKPVIFKYAITGTSKLISVCLDSELS